MKITKSYISSEYSQKEGKFKGIKAVTYCRNLLKPLWQKVP